MRSLKAAVKILVATLREIFDEAPYRRFLDRTGQVSSPRAYDAFWRERQSIHARRHRCC
jgi:hypothetical protein